MLQKNQTTSDDDQSLTDCNCRRKQEDRRCRPTPLFSKYTFFGSRRMNRRQGDQPHSYYVDIYDRKIVGLVLLIFFFCIMDAILTLILLGRGASEVNPIMGYYLKLGGNHFLGFKLVSTGIGLLILLFHQNFKRVQKIIGGLCTFYALLVTYQLILLILSVVY